MKIAHISIAALAGVSLLCTSCVVGPYDGYGTFSYSTNGYSSTVAWTSASYDANGFPIYGYSYGRPVYGYTATGAAIFTIGALTALCFVPDWGPAPWYRGHWHYPPHIHRAPGPPPPGPRPPPPTCVLRAACTHRFTRTRTRSWANLHRISPLTTRHRRSSIALT